MSPLRLLVAVTAGLLALLVAGSPATADEPSRTVLVGAPGLSWSDIDADATPTLWRLAEEGAVASLTVRAVRSRSCAVDGWLTLSAGRRAADLPGPCVAPGALAVDGEVPRWDAYLEAAREDGFGAEPGTLAARLTTAGSCVEAVGPAAAIGAASPDGTVARAAGSLPDAFACPLVLVDGGTLPADEPGRLAAARQVDGVVSAVLDLDPEATVLVAGLGDGDSRIGLRALLAAGPDIAPGLLTSPSTRQPGLVQLQDVTATLLERAGAPVADVTGRPMTVDPSDADVAERAADRVGFEVRAGTLRSVSPQVTGWLAAVFAGWCAVASLLLWRRGASAPLPAAVRVAGVALAAVPAATFAANLVPWWRAGAPGLAFTAVLAFVVAAVTAVAVAVERRRRLGALLVVAVVTLALLVGDVATGSGLQLASVFGQNPTVGGRFYGVGNTSYALYGVATMAVVALLAVSRRGSPRSALALSALALLVLTAVEGYPSLGADFGGPPGLVLGGLVVLAGASRVRIGAARALLAVAGVVVLTAGVAVLDWLRAPAARTHLGEFVQTVLDGGVGDVIGRKLAQNLTNLSSPPLLTISVAAVVLGLVAWRSGWRPGVAGRLVLRGSAVLALVGFAVNDSGLVVPAFAALALLPLLAAAGPASVAGAAGGLDELDEDPPGVLGVDEVDA